MHGRLTLSRQALPAVSAPCARRLPVHVLKASVPQLSPGRQVVCHWQWPWPGGQKETTQQQTATDSKPLNFQTATSALWQAQRVYDKYDKDKSGTLTLAEATALLNSDDIRNVVQTLTNVTPLRRTEKDISKAFEAADKNHDGVLSRQEFMALYLAMVGDRVKANPVVLAEALLGFLDTNRNGKIEGNELKVMLALLGFPQALLVPIPGFVNVDYRGILSALDGSKK